MKRIIIAAGLAAMGAVFSNAGDYDRPAIEQLHSRVPGGADFNNLAIPRAEPVSDLASWTSPVRWEMVTKLKSNLPGETPPRSGKEFCARLKDYNYFQRLILGLENRLSFRNAGGLGGGGVCWWHSRLNQRQIYLTVFRPELSKPSKKQVLEIFSGYFWGDRVVEIPGYENFYDFSTDWRELLQRKLNEWQLIDGLAGAWINGLAGGTSIAPKKLKAGMDILFEEVNNSKRIVWQKLQLPGITSHAWLVTQMSREDGGYILTVVDSNYSSAYNVRYREGKGALSAADYPDFVPYTEFLGDFNKIRRAQENYCSGL